MPREVLLNELRVLRGRKLQRTLAEFTPAEREAILAMISAKPPHPESAHTPFSALVGLSPWLLKALDRTEREGADNSHVTMATRTALRAAVQEVTRRKPVERSLTPRARGGLMRMFDARTFRRPNA